MGWHRPIYLRNVFLEWGRVAWPHRLFGLEFQTEQQRAEDMVDPAVMVAQNAPCNAGCGQAAGIGQLGLSTGPLEAEGDIKIDFTANDMRGPCRQTASGWPSR